MTLRRALTSGEAERLAVLLAAKIPVTAIGSVPSWAVRLVIEAFLQHCLPAAFAYLREIGAVHVEADLVEIVDKRT